MIKDDKVFVYSNTTVYALNKDTGGTLWSTSIWGDTSRFGSWASPAYSDDKLYVSSGYSISRINAADGALEQLVPFPDGGHSCNGGPTVVDGVVYAGSGYGNPTHYYALDASDLTNVLWSFSVGSYVAGSTPAVASGMVVFGNSSSLTCVNTADGTILWTTDLSGGTAFGSAAIDSANDRVYVATSSGSLALLHALNLTNGNLIWTSTTSIDYTDGTPAFLDPDHVYISGNAWGVPGHTYCFNGTGVLQWTVPCGSRCMSPALADGKLFTGDCDDMCGLGTFEGIGAYDALTGALIWEYDYGGSAPSVANPDGMVVSIGKNGRVYAFGNPILPTPLIITGWVSKADNTPCDNPSVLITNTATGEDWNAKTLPASNYYRLIIPSDAVRAGNILQITASGSQSKTMLETVSQDTINGGGFSLNITIGQLPGDINEDGNITAADAAIALRMAVRGEYLKVADVNGDMSVTSLDALMIMEWTMG
jgi:outer membrane protein assembly factor BamB